jgi:ATP-dependent Clp protease ATP-binding subunit ClpA
MDVYRMSGAARRVFEAAEREAIALGNGRLEPAHLLLGLWLEPGAAQVALADANVPIVKLRKTLDELYDGPRGGKARDLDRSSGELREGLETAREEADAEGEHDIPALRLFMAATEGIEDDDEGQGAVAVLRALGVNVEKARARAASLARDEAQGSLPST